MTQAWFVSKFFGGSPWEYLDAPAEMAAAALHVAEKRYDARNSGD